jgi:fatty acid desaturase/predicted Zn-dependent protease with MMP-like domain
MPREQDRIVGHLGQLVGEAVVEGQRIAAGKIGAAATLEEQGVARHERTVEHEALTSRSVTGCVDQLDRDVADHDDVAARVENEIGRDEIGDLAHELTLLGLHMDRDVHAFEELVDALDRVPHHLSTDMIGVVVRGENSGESHVIRFEDAKDAVDVVGGIDGDRLTGLAITDQIDEVHHLPRQRIVLGDVASGEQLTEIQTAGSGGIGHCPILAGRGQNWDVTSRVPLSTVVPPAEDLPDVLPTDRLGPTGMPTPALRAQFRRMHDARNVANVLLTWLEPALLLGFACWWTPGLPLAAAIPVWVAVFLLMGRTFARLSILGHEAAHRLLFSNRRVNDVVGAWLCDYPAFVPFDAYRRQHMAHHRDELGPNEPDLNLYRGYPIPAASMRRKLRRDLLGSSGWKNLRGLLLALTRTSSRPFALRIIAVQVVLFAAMGLASGRWWLWSVMWLAPWMTIWRVLNRLRGIAEHGGMEHSADRRRTTHVIRQSWLPRMWIAPFNTGWHLAHHTDMGVPFQQLPALHDELVAAGWVTPAIEYRSYTAL